MTLLVAQLVLRTSLTRAMIAAVCLGIIGFLILMTVSFLEHRRPVPTSTLFLLYSRISVPAGVLRARTLMSMPQNVPIAAIFTVFTACKSVILILEMRPKTNARAFGFTADEKAAIVSRAFLWWPVPLFRAGYRTPLTSVALPDVEHDLTRTNGTQGRQQDKHADIRDQQSLMLILSR